MHTPGPHTVSPLHSAHAWPSHSVSQAHPRTCLVMSRIRLPVPAGSLLLSEALQPPWLFAMSCNAHPPVSGAQAVPHCQGPSPWDPWERALPCPRLALANNYQGSRSAVTLIEVMCACVFFLVSLFPAQPGQLEQLTTIRTGCPCYGHKVPETRRLERPQMCSCIGQGLAPEGETLPASLSGFCHGQRSLEPASALVLTQASPELAHWP